MLNHLDLFSGIGGFALGLRQAGGFKTVAFSEIDKFACKVLAARFADVPNLGGVEGVKKDQIEGPIGIITAGFPCQDLSVAGKRAGLAGERSGLFWHVVRCVSEFRPDWFLLENVPGLLSSNNGRDMGTVIGALQDCGYSVAWRVLDARYFGVAQRRRRVWIVGNTSAERAAAVLFEPEGGAGDSEACRETQPDVAYSLGASTGGVSGKEQQQTLVTHALTGEGCDASEDGTGRGTPIVAETLRCGGRSQGAGSSYDNTPYTTVKFTSPDADRMRDATGLPKGMDSARYRALGNAVPVPVVEWIGRRIIEIETKGVTMHD